MAADWGTILTSGAVSIGSVGVVFLGGKVASLMRGERAKTDVETGHQLRDDLVAEITRLKVDIQREEVERRDETGNLRQELARCEEGRVTLVHRIEAMERQIIEAVKLSAVAGERERVQTDAAATAAAVSAARVEGVREGLAAPGHATDSAPASPK